MKSFKLILAGLVVAAPFAAVAAEGSYFYVGAGLGDSKTTIDDVFDDGSNLRFDDNDTAFKVFGGWNFNKYFGVEVAYADFGEGSDRYDFAGIDTEIKIANEGFETYLTATLPLGFFQVYGKGGYVWYDATATIEDDTSAVRASNSDGSWAWAFGLGIVLFDTIPINLEYEILDVQDVDDSEVIWLTAAWRFGG